MKQITIVEQLDNNQFTLYDNKLGSILREFSGFEYPTVQESIDDVAGPYGSVYITSKYGRRPLSVLGDIVTADPYAMRRQLQKALRQTGTIKLLKFTTYDDLNLQCEAEVVKVRMPYTHTVHTFLIEFVAPDWRFYSQDLVSQDVGLTIIRGGFAIPTAIPISFMSPSSESTLVNNIITNMGNEITDPVFTIHGPGNGFTIGNGTTEEQFVLDYLLGADDVVVIDVKRRTVVLNGVTNIYSAIDGDFWSIPLGESDLRFLVDEGLTMNTNLNVAFRHAYAGI